MPSDVFGMAFVPRRPQHALWARLGVVLVCDSGRGIRVWAWHQSVGVAVWRRRGSPVWVW